MTIIIASILFVVITGNTLKFLRSYYVPSHIRLFCSSSCFMLQSTPDNLNLQGKSKKVRVIGSSKQITGNKNGMGNECN